LLFVAFALSSFGQRFARLYLFLEINNLFLFASLAICSALQLVVYFRTITLDHVYDMWAENLEETMAKFNQSTNAKT